MHYIYAFIYICIYTSCPITTWQIDAKTVETLADFIFGGSKITADGDCSHEIKRHLLFGRKVQGQVGENVIPIQFR